MHVKLDRTSHEAACAHEYLTRRAVWCEQSKEAHTERRKTGLFGSESGSENSSKGIDMGQVAPACDETKRHCSE